MGRQDPATRAGGRVLSSFLAITKFGSAKYFMRRATVAVGCPRCQSRATHRSKRRGTFELTILSVIPLRPFRCEDCDRRFYAFVSATDSVSRHSHSEALR